MIEQRKAFAYITQGDRLLVFTHPDHPEAGIQVPAGTIEEGETPEAAVLREAREETGLDNLVLEAYLGYCGRDMSDFGLDQVHHRYFFHLRCPGGAPAAWRHGESTPHGQTRATPIRFDFYWVQLPDAVPELIAGHGQMLGQLVAVMGLTR